MSSILDALRKLEEEKSAAAEIADIAVDDVIAERDLIGGGGGGVSLQVTPMMLLFAGGGVFVLTAALVIAVVVLVDRNGQLPPAAMEVPAPPLVTASSTVPEGLVEPAPSAIVPAGETVVVTEMASPTAVVTPTPAPATEPPPSVSPPRVDLQGSGSSVKPAPRITVPESRAAVPVAEPVETNEPAETTLSADEPKRDYPDDVNLWPRLSTALKARVVGDKKLNMARPSGRPRPSAVIDMESVYIGEMIPDTKARLVEVTGFGIGIEVVGTGEKYYWRMGA